MPVILEKLPSKVKTQIARKHGYQPWTLGELTEAINKEIEANIEGEGDDTSPSAVMFLVKSSQKGNKGHRESQSGNRESHQKNYGQRSKKQYGHRVVTNHNMVVHNSDHNSKDVRFAVGRTTLHTAGKFTQIAKITKVIIKRRLCFNCLKPGHIYTANECLLSFR